MSNFKELPGETREAFLEGYRHFWNQNARKKNPDHIPYVDGHSITYALAGLYKDYLEEMAQAWVASKGQYSQQEFLNDKQGYLKCTERIEGEFGEILLPFPSENFTTFKIGLIDDPVEGTYSSKNNEIIL